MTAIEDTPVGAPPAHLPLIAPTSPSSLHRCCHCCHCCHHPHRCHPSPPCSSPLCHKDVRRRLRFPLRLFCSPVHRGACGVWVFLVWCAGFHCGGVWVLCSGAVHGWFSHAWRQLTRTRAAHMGLQSPVRDRTPWAASHTPAASRESAPRMSSEGHPRRRRQRGRDEKFWIHSACSWRGRGERRQEGEGECTHTQSRSAHNARSGKIRNCRNNRSCKAERQGCTALPARAAIPVSVRARTRALAWLAPIYAQCPAASLLRCR